MLSSSLDRGSKLRGPSSYCSEVWMSVSGWLWRSCGYGHGLVVDVSSVRAPVSVKTNFVEWMKHVKSVEVQNPPVGVEVRRGALVKASSSSLDHGSKLLSICSTFF
ncbi:hypothetical protein TNCV_4854941 [Trichonephila clavipes]|nr:hypothetical protein TNCV_4854941 [Trichonephila clavipes]